MENLIIKINNLKQTEISDIIKKRIKEFESLEDKKLFSELCFCLLTANFQAEKSIQIQKELEDCFHNLDEKKLAIRLKTLGHRFWPQRARRIVLARAHQHNLLRLRISSSKIARFWLLNNVGGLGMKESSHFLRNIGHKDIAIIDFHIIDLLKKENILNQEIKKSLTPRRYLEIESTLRNLGNELSLSLAELDLYLWYIETGKVLK